MAQTGVIIEHEDGRQGVAFHDKQTDYWRERNKIVVNFFIDGDSDKSLDLTDRAVDASKLNHIGFWD